MIRIVTDSSAQLDPHWSKQHDVTVLPHHVTVDGHEYAEGVDIDHGTLAQKVKLAKCVTIGGPTPAEFATAYRKLADEKVDIVSLHVSAALSDTIRNAEAACAEFRGRASIHVVDSRCVALGLHELVMATQVAIDRRLPVDDVVQHVRGLIPHVYGIFVSDDMKVLERSKRLRPAQAELGRMLGIIPCLSLEEGDIVAVEKVRNAEKAIERLAEFAGEFDAFERLAILQLVPERHEQVNQLIEQIEPLFPDFKKVPLELAGPIIGNIIGAHGYGVMIYEGELGLK
jgi:DegV family protein with EDD domain